MEIHCCEFQLHRKNCEHAEKNSEKCKNSFFPRLWATLASLDHGISFLSHLKFMGMGFEVPSNYTENKIDKRIQADFQTHGKNRTEILWHRFSNQIPWFKIATFDKIALLSSIHYHSFVSHRRSFLGISPWMNTIQNQLQLPSDTVNTTIKIKFAKNSGNNHPMMQMMRKRKLPISWRLFGEDFRIFERERFAECCHCQQMAKTGCYRCVQAKIP